MTVLQKTERDIATMRRGGHLLAAILDELIAEVQPGASTASLDAYARKRFAHYGATPSFLGYEGFPAAICVSVNEEVVHGIPRDDRILERGDLVSLDLGVYLDGFHTDTAATVTVGRPARIARKLLKIVSAALAAGVRTVRPGATTGDIGHEIQSVVETAGFAVVRQLVGHGVGRKLHELPQVPNYGEPGSGVTLTRGMTIAIEPMVTVGSGDVETLKDGWTVVTADGTLAAHAEHTVAVTEQGAEILTAKGE